MSLRLLPDPDNDESAAPVAAAAFDADKRDPLRKRLLLLFALCLAEYLPISLLYTTIPVLMRRGGASLDDIGALTVAFFPWALKFLWAPVIDRWGGRRIGRYRGWLLTLVPVVAAMVVLLAFVDLPHMLLHAREVGVAFLVALTIVCATIDTAAHGLGVVLLTPAERGFGNGIQTAGQMMGNLIGGGVAVACIGLVGWRLSCLMLAALYALPFVATLLAREPRLPPTARPQALRDFVAVIKRPRSPRWFVWIAAFGVAYGLFGVPYQAALVDAGLDMTEIGVVQGIVMSITGIAGGLAGGVLAKRASRIVAFYIAGVLFAVSLAPSVLTFSVFGAARWSLYVGLSSAYFGVAAIVTVLYAMMMDRSASGTASSDFTAQYSALQISGFVSWGLGAVLAQRIGTAMTFMVAIGLVLGLLVAARFAFTPSDFAPAQPNASA